MKNILTSFTVSAFALTTYCQLTITPTPDQQTLQTLLQGFGVVIGNVQINGSPQAYGSFWGNSEMPVTNGLILSTGNVIGIAAPAAQSGSYGTDLGLGGYSNLDNLASGNGRDACVLEFDALPAGDTLMFNFAFGSEEYPEYAPPSNSTYNDVFAVFMSGPGINGMQNVATLPNQTIVSINNVNAVTNSQYYMDNSAGQYVVFDGITTNVFVKRAVNPGQRYHFIIAIEDIDDGIYDSGILLQAYSFRSNSGADGESPLQAKIGPNPCTDAVQLSFKSETADIAVFNTAGTRIQQTDNVWNGYFMDTKSLEPGVYIIRFTANGNTDTKRLIKQ